MPFLGSNYTGRAPRTSGQAFSGADYGAAIERPAPRFWTPVRIALALTYLAAFITLGVVL